MRTAAVLNETGGLMMLPCFVEYPNDPNGISCNKKYVLLPYKYVCVS